MFNTLWSGDALIHHIIGELDTQGDLTAINLCHYLWNTNLAHPLIIKYSYNVLPGITDGGHDEGFSLSLHTTRKSAAVWQTTQVAQSAEYWRSYGVLSKFSARFHVI